MPSSRTAGSFSAGESRAGDNGAFALARYAADGILDPSFSADGRLLTDFGAPATGAIRIHNAGEGAWGVDVQADGRIVAAGEDESGSASDLALARYASDGSLDPGFSGDGVQTTDLGGSEQTRDLVLQSGRALVVGNTDAGSAPADFDSLLARYQADFDHYVRVEVTVAGPGRVGGPRIACPPDCVGSYATPQLLALTGVPDDEQSWSASAARARARSARSSPTPTLP